MKILDICTAFYSLNVLGVCIFSFNPHNSLLWKTEEVYLPLFYVWENSSIREVK